jgi:N-acetylmuramoyl-L-alanine amidase
MWLWLGLGVAPASAGVRAAPAAQPAVGLIGVRFGASGPATRVVLDLDAAVAGRLLAAEASPGRLVIALPPLLFPQAPRGPGQGLVAGWSIEEDARGARLILAVRPGASAVRRFLIPPDQPGGRWRYVIDVGEADPVAALIAGAAGPMSPPRISPSRAVPARTSPVRLAALAPSAAPASSIPSAPPTTSSPGTPDPRPARAAHAPAPATAQAGAPPEPAQPPPAIAAAPRLAAAGRPTPAVAPMAASTPGRRAAERGVKVIVVDAGHGGHDTGARSLVRNEKDINLAAALALKARLERMGRYKVVLTRDSDVFIPLEARVQIARRAKADLFISLHSDSAGSDPAPHGASVYTLSDHGQTRVNTVLGPHEWFSQAGDRRTEPSVRQILLDLTQRSTRNRSSQFASLLIDHIGDRVDLLPRTHRDAGYFVLLAPDVPAVLLEMGFITNPADEMRLTDPAQREALAHGIAEAIDAYFFGETRLATG